VAIRQKIPRATRSTVATATEIYDYLRLLFARCGQTFCIKCGAEVLRDNPKAIAGKVLSLAPGAGFTCSMNAHRSGTTRGTRRGKKKLAPPAQRFCGTR